MTQAVTPKESSALARKRDAAVLWLLSRHPSTASMLVDIGFFPNRKKASKRLHRLTKRRKLRLLGTVSLKCGRPEHVYGRGHWNTTNLTHEVLLTKVCLKIDASEVRRGHGEVDATLRPDAELLIGGRRFFLELDCGTMGYTDVVRKRFAKYQASEELVLWVCPTPARVEGLRRHATMIRSTALFTTLDQVLANPHGLVWNDCDGVRAALPRSPKPGA
jgi:hypothetical protein